MSIGPAQAMAEERAAERARRLRDDQNRAAAETERTDYEWLMRSPKGRRIVMRILKQSRFDRLCPSLDPEELKRHEGRRTIGCALNEMLKDKHPEFYLQMMKEDLNNDPDAD